MIGQEALAKSFHWRTNAIFEEAIRTYDPRIVAKEGSLPALDLES